MEIVGVVLAGGRSSRMGMDKGLLLFKGKPLVKHSVDALNSSLNSVVLIANNKSYNEFNLPVFTDLVEDKGPLGGIFTAMNEVDADYLFVLSCDTPFVTKELVQLMIESIDGEQIIVVQHGAKVEPLIGLYHKSIIDVIKNQLDVSDLKLMSLLSHCDVKHFNTAMLGIDEAIFRNINTPNDLERIKNEN